MMGWLGAHTPTKRARIMGFGSDTPYTVLAATGSNDEDAREPDCAPDEPFPTREGPGRIRERTPIRPPGPGTERDPAVCGDPLWSEDEARNALPTEGASEQPVPKSRRHEHGAADT